jgi:NADPH:quinone reductase-like Zn-dependent oxidoreductase
MTTSRTAAIIWGSFALLVLVIAAVALCAIYTAPDAAYATLGTVALSIGGAGGVGSLAVGLRHAGAKEPGSSAAVKP